MTFGGGRNSRPAGRLSIDHDRARMDRYWNAVVAAWHPKGHRDPGLTLLAMDCEDAQVWVSTAGPMKAVWEIAKANAMRREPEVGTRAHLTFRTGPPPLNSAAA